MAIRGHRILKKNIIKILLALVLVVISGITLNIYFSLDKTPKRAAKKIDLVIDEADAESGKMGGKGGGDIGPLGLDLSILRRKEFMNLQTNAAYVPPIGGQKEAMITDDDSPPILKSVNIDDPGIGNQLNLFWTKQDNAGIAQIRIYRFKDENSKGDLIAELDGSRTNFSDHDVDFIDNRLEIDEEEDYKTTYHYLLKTVNQAGIESKNTKKYIGTTTNVIPPGIPYDIQIQQKDETLEILWSNPSDYDLKHIIIYRSENKFELGKIVAEIEASSNKKHKWRDENIALYIQYYYHLSAVDEAGNRSASNIIHIGNDELFISELEK